MKKILILGAGFGQLPAIKCAKQMGLQVIVADKNDKSIGKSFADIFYATDIIDKEGILKIAQEHQVNGVMTMQSDIPVPTIGFVNDQLELSGVNYNTANYCSNKIQTRERLEQMVCSQPKFAVIRNLEEADQAIQEIGLPVVVKAPDSSGSRGVVKVNEKNLLSEAIDEALKYTKGNQLLIEEYIEGIEFGAQTFSVNGVCEVVLLHNDIMSPPPYMIPIGHSLPFNAIPTDKHNSIISDVKNAISALGIDNGPANVDLILDKNSGRVKIIEIGARIGATCLPELVFYHTGIDWVKQTILNAISEKGNLTVYDNVPVAAYILESPKDGIFAGFEIDEKYNNSNIIEVEVTAKKNENINKLRKGTDRIGKVVAKGVNVNEAEITARSLRDSITLYR